ncbi:MAG: hypothetical protein LBL34_01015 [Clostridiales bacterium]|jgi:hypothetical protein|nr:hypothetical protein [Clostridiales bacterium]
MIDGITILMAIALFWGGIAIGLLVGGAKERDAEEIPREERKSGVSFRTPLQTFR